MAARSYLYVPAESSDRLVKATTRGADAVIFDLEDSIPPAGKAAARSLLADHLRAVLPGSDTPLWVRINSDTIAEDLAAVTGPAVAGVVVPKAEPDVLNEVDRRLTTHERRQGLPAGSVCVIPLIETACGVLRVEQVATAQRVTRLGLGEADLIGDLGLQPGPERHELAGVRLQIVLASAAARLVPPIGPVDTHLNEPQGLYDSTRLLLQQGFRARTAIHPRQIAEIHRALTPNDDEIARAQDLIATLDAANIQGTGVAVDRHGYMLDAAVVRTAYEVLSRASNRQLPMRHSTTTGSFTSNESHPHNPRSQPRQSP